MKRVVWSLCTLLMLAIQIMGIQGGPVRAEGLQTWRSQEGPGPYDVIFDGQIYRNRWWVSSAECPADAGPTNWSNAWQWVRPATADEIDTLGNPTACGPVDPGDIGSGTGDSGQAGGIDWSGTQALVGDNPSPWPTQVFAPYVDGTMAMPELADLKRATGAAHFIVAFIVTTSADDCNPTWGGAYRLQDFRAADGWNGPDLYGQIKRLREAGGDVMVSIGGAFNNPPAKSCQDVETLTDLYLDIITHLNLRALDFDIEGAHLADAGAIARHGQALKQVQDELRRQDRRVALWYTLPSLPSGLTINGMNVLRSALEQGVEIDGVNIMAMDTYQAACEPAGNEGQAINGNCAVAAAESLHDQLKTLYPQKSDSALWRMIGVTPMIGVNDNPREIFYLSDADLLLDFARQKGLGLISMWSLGRDQPAAEGQQALAGPTHSGLSDSQAARHEFTQTLSSYTTDDSWSAEEPDDDWVAEEPDDPWIEEDTLPVPDAGNYPPFEAGTAYQAEEIVSHAGADYRCRPWPYTDWCAVGGPYEPGTGWAWEQAWSLVN